MQRSLLRWAPQYGFVGWYIVTGAVLALCLVGYGAYLTPATNRLSVAAAATVLLAYLAIGCVGVPMLLGRRPAVIETAQWAGLAAGTVFAVEICLEYVFLPKDNAIWGIVEFGLVFCIYAGAGIWLTVARQGIREAMIGSALSAVVSSITWCIFILTTFYLFYGTQRQESVFQAEGNFDDFRRSGMHDFPAFIMEDFLGATFFHLTLGPAIASALGLACGAIEKGLARIVRARFRGLVNKE